MKQIIVVLWIALLATPALAAAEKQQERTKACNAAAEKKGLKGDKHKAYVKACLSAKPKKKQEAAAKPEKKTARPATPATPAQPSAASAATQPAPGPNTAAEKKRLKCDEIARQSNVSPQRRNDFMDKCMAG